MASFSELYDTYGANPISWSQYPGQLQADDVRTQVGLNSYRQLRDFQQYNLPDMLSNFAARGTFFSGRRQREAQRLATGVTENIGDEARRAGTTLSDLATSGVGTAIGGGF